ncbi:Na(+)-translocating NADH-quinone reductase subunit F [Sporomusa silvacetica DSM 10669]|uniref:Na(+)-translocating NADH-quinone reductase subunit F n=1 Tax=Sporomusa silvacetica DSM 10669 TaxID=1123289 RepID=A0ABZ3IPS9_9FIRM|nr:ASKHA domain-containing protein [Sporomusa silvacetica]OZC13811.1 Na(+)-translocating NADH-quinone reductase subunit F [Sporomusa silvacetica DSM 10669]
MQIKVNSESLAVAEGENLMETLLRYNQPVTNICNGQGSCGKCKVQIITGAPAPTELEYQKLSAGELATGVRLACLVQPQPEMALVCGASGNVDRKEGLLFIEQASSEYCGVSQVQVNLDLPTLEDERGDWNRLLAKLQETCPITDLKIGLSQLQTLSPVIRQENLAVSAVMWKDQILAVLPGAEKAPVYGVAIDIGTTNIAVALYNLETGAMVRLAAAENGQTRYGADVISRIEFANKGVSNRNLLREAVTGTINGLLNKLCNAAEIASNQIYKAVVVGNTTMHHLFLGLDVSYLALSPFVSVCNADLELDASEVGFVLHPQAKVIMFPNVGGFVGGDTLGAILGSEELLATGRHLLIDIGTNCELYLQDGTKMWACSTAAGPAFEGAGITHGVRAQPGAIERVAIDEQGVSLAVIGGGAATGICGSGLIEAVQQMRKARIISQSGTINDPNDLEVQAELVPELLTRIRDGQQKREFVLAYNPDGEDIVLTQHDISQLQLAKGAVCAGIRTLLDIAGLSVADLDSIVLAGTFATHLNLASTVDIGLIPHLSLHKLKTAGNAAHAGAVKALLDQRAFTGLRQQANKIEHVELGGSATFSMYFMDSMCIEPCEI